MRIINNTRKVVLGSAAGFISLTGFVNHASAAVILNDTFASPSSLNSVSPAAPTSTSASYQLIGSKTALTSPSIGAGALKFGIASTTSGSIEAQAQFTSAPITLATTGDFVEFTLTFTNTTNILTQAMQMGFGLYNSGGTGPVAGGMSTTGNVATSSTTAHTTGGTVGWQGYVSQITFTGSTGSASTKFMDRKMQNVGTITDNAQDLVTSGSGTSSYSFPSAATVGTANTTTPPEVALAANGQYTEDVKITLLATGALQLDSNMTDSTNTNISSMTATTGITPLTTTFDGLAFGFRSVAAGTGGYILTANSLTVQTNVTASPEPGSLALLTLGAITLLRRARK